ncbi:MAG: L,D-transpeptidase family protein [Parcubacteria group bacterium]|nr:L,D-transpeptidase family protein [Parcubacteria group bacterium]
MHIPIEHHERVVGNFWKALLLLLAVLALALFDIGPFQQKKEKVSVVGEYLKSEEAVIVTPKGEELTNSILPIQKVLFEYVEVTDSCGPNFVGECLNARSGPGAEFPAITKLRKGVVLKVGGKVEREGFTWYKIVFDEWLRYPERVKGDFYVAADYVRILYDEGERKLIERIVGGSNKRIVVDRSLQMLSAYDGDELFMQEKISTGLELTPTPKGTFTIFKKTPSRYMQGPIPSITEKFYDLPGVPWNLYFTSQGAVIHGTYWHENFGKPSSNGCVNLPPAQAEKLYKWADVGTLVVVQN